jgi:hypothetical protein
MQIDEVDILLLNMKAGLLPKDLTESEVKLLEERYGSNWFTELGYDEWEYERSNYHTLIVF